MKKGLIYFILFSILLSSAACSSYQGFDVNDTWRPKQHKRYDLSQVPNRQRGKR